MTHEDALECAKTRARTLQEVFYVFHDENGEYFYGDGEDAIEQFFPEEIIETVYPDGVAVDHSPFLNPATES